jgi:hypothetical protein
MVTPLAFLLGLLGLSLVCASARRARRGRPGKPIPVDVRSKWVKELNAGLDCPVVGWSSYSKPAVFDLGCGHVACVRLDSVREKPGILSTCFYCHRTGSK